MKSAKSRSARPFHVVLEHRNESDFKCYLETLRSKEPQKLCIFSDFQWIQSGLIISGDQRQRLFEALGGISKSLRNLQVDLLCDVFLPGGESDLDFDLNEDNSLAHTRKMSQEEAHVQLPATPTTALESSREMELVSMIQKRHVLPCSLITRLLSRSPLLESLVLKELWLSGSASNVHDLVQVLQSHPTLAKIDLRWKLAGSKVRNGLILDPLIAGICGMPQLTNVNLMLPYWSPSLELLPLSTTLSTVKLTVESVADFSNITRLLETWKHCNAALRHLELSTFHILQHDSVLAAILALLENNSHLEHLAAIDHDIFSSPTSGTANRETGYSRASHDSKAKLSAQCSKTRKTDFDQRLIAALQTNTALKHLQLISKTRRRPKSHDRIATRQLFAKLLETNCTLEHLDISHAGLHFSAPVLCNSDLLRLDNHTDCPNVLARQQRGGDSLDFYLRLNQDGFRRQLLLERAGKIQGDDDDATYNLWYKAIRHYQLDTASVFALLQGCPSVLSELAVAN
jgi:hypothetical protein